MKEEIVQKIERTDKDIDNSVYEIKVEHTDDYGNLYYTKVMVLCSEYEKDIDTTVSELEQSLKEAKKKRDNYNKIDIEKITIN